MSESLLRFWRCRTQISMDLLGRAASAASRAVVRYGQPNRSLVSCLGTRLPTELRCALLPVATSHPTFGLVHVLHPRLTPGIF